jgi:hypothetical protein
VRARGLARRLAIVAGPLASALACAPQAWAAPVLIMGRQGHVRLLDDRFLPARALTPVLPPITPSPAPLAAAPAAADAARKQPPPAPQAAIRGVLARLRSRRLIAPGTFRADCRLLWAAVRLGRRLRGTPAAELAAVVANLRELAAAGMLTPSRLPALFLTLRRNIQWWRSGVVPGTWEPIEFAGSQLIWQYYPGQGIELQVLGTFGKADGLYAAGPSHYGALRELLGEMIPLAVRRAGGLAWEYYFHFDGGSPPWISAMAQGTAIEALTRASKAFGAEAGVAAGEASYLSLAQRALAPFAVAPPVGVRVATRLGARYLQYSFAPTTDIINAFLQALIGLFDYARASGDAQAWRLFAAGDAQARAELPEFDTGAWSLYQPGVPDSLAYHELVTGFLQQLCARTSAPVYCTTARRFRRYLRTPPALSLITTSAPARRPVRLRFRLSKPSHVGVVVLRAGQAVFLMSADFVGPIGSFALPPLRAGRYTIHLAATDLAGNFNRIVAQLTVSARGRAG